MPLTQRSLTALAFGLALTLTILPGQALHAGPTRDNPFGLGLEVETGYTRAFLGNLTLSGKYWMNSTNAVDMELGGGNGGLDLGADYLWHNYQTFNSRDIALFYGVGGFTDTGYGIGILGIRGKLGVDWLFRHSPWEAFVDVAPGLNLINGLGFGVNLEGGARYYFF